MQEHDRVELEALALKSIADVAASLNTKIDTLSPWDSFGKVFTSDERQHSSNNNTGSRVTSSAQLDNEVSADDTTVSRLVSNVALERAKLLEEASEFIHPLSSYNNDDDEATALKSLPRATLEAMLLSVCSTHRAYQSRYETANIPHPFGATLGLLFESYVEVRRAKSAAAPVPALLPRTYSVVRNGLSPAPVSTMSLLSGDLVVLGTGDVVPADALFLAIEPKSAFLSISCQRIHGSALAVDRQRGAYRVCPFFGAKSILPQQSILLSASADAKILVVCLRAPSSSSWWVRQNHALSMDRRAHQPNEPDSLRVVELQPFTPVPQPTIHQYQRHAVQRVAKCDTVVVECDAILLDETRYEVTDVVWASTQYAAPSVASLWNASDVLMGTNVTASSSMSVTRPLSSTVDALHGRCQIRSFLVADSERPTRVPLVDTAGAFRSLLISAMLATCYPSSAEQQQQHAAATATAALDAKVLSRASVRAFLMSDDHLARQQHAHYRPIGDPAKIALGGSVVHARLFDYNIPGAAKAEAHRHAVLVVYGDADCVLAASALMSTPQGQKKIDVHAHRALDQLRESVVCAPSFLFGVASADILWDYIGTKNVPSPSDLASLLAQSTALCYHGALVSQVALRSSAVRGLHALSVNCGKRVCLISFARSRNRLKNIMERCLSSAVHTAAAATGGGGSSSCHSPAVTVVEPDVLGRWEEEPPPAPGGMVGFSAVGCDAADLLPRIHRWSGIGSGLTFVGATCLSLVGLRVANVGVLMTTEDDIAVAVLRSAAHIAVSHFALDDFAEAIR